MKLKIPIGLYKLDARSEGASVHEKRQKKVWIFRPIDFFNFGFFRSDDLVILTVHGILARKDRQCFLDFMVLSKENTLFEKDHCTKNPHFFLAKNRPTFRPGIIYKLWESFNEKIIFRIFLTFLKKFLFHFSFKMKQKWISDFFQK